VTLTAFGYYVPMLWLMDRIRERKERIEQVFPNALDLLQISVEAGLGFDTAMTRVGNELVRTSPDIAFEFLSVQRQVQAGRARDTALLDIADRTGVDTVRSFANVVQQSMQFGTSMGEALEAYAREILGPYFRQPKAGSVWFKTLTDMETDPRLERFHRRRHLTELAIIPLSVEDKATMFLEMHFSVHRGTGQHALINLCAPTLADTWSRRKPGLMTELILKRNRPNPTSVADVPILGADNPTGLSRAEFRVCLLLSAGLSTKRVCSQLGISESTLRTHLRSIYAKTETCSQSELLYVLLSPKPCEAAQLRGIA
jgi:DNA-binding CsgD family transcriptional regulator